MKPGKQVGRVLKQDGIAVSAHKVRGQLHCVVVRWPDGRTRIVWGPSDAGESAALDATTAISRAAFDGCLFDGGVK